MRILVLGAGVIGSVYAAKLLQAGHEVVVFARGSRLANLRDNGLVVQDAESGVRTVLSVRCIGEIGVEDRFELVLVPVRFDQLLGTLPVLTAMRDGSTVLFFGNAANRQAELVAALGERALFGFPAVGGVRDGPMISYVLIGQQKTMLGELDGTRTSRVRHLHGVFSDAGFATAVSADITGWLSGHVAFVVPIAFALYRVGLDPRRLADDRATMRLMVGATREAFTVLRQTGNREIPTNLRILYSLPTMFVVAYWRRVFAGPRGELWFAAHSRAARAEMHAVARELQAAVRSAERPTPDLDRLLATPV